MTYTHDRDELRKRIGDATVRIFLPVFKMNFPEIVDMALPAEGVFHNLVFVSIRKQYPYQGYKIMHGLWGMGQMMFSKYIIVVDEDAIRMAIAHGHATSAIGRPCSSRMSTRSLPAFSSGGDGE